MSELARLVDDVMSTITFCNCGEEKCLPDPEDTRAVVVELLTRLDLVTTDDEGYIYVKNLDTDRLYRPVVKDG